MLYNFIPMGPPTSVAVSHFASFSVALPVTMSPHAPSLLIQNGASGEVQVALGPAGITTGPNHSGAGVVIVPAGGSRVLPTVPAGATNAAVMPRNGGAGLVTFTRGDAGPAASEGAVQSA